MPAWLSPDASIRDGASPVEHAPSSPAIQSADQAPPVDAQSTTIDVTSFLSADDLPIWIRRIADPAAAEETIGPISAQAPEPEPQSAPQPQPQPQPLARIGSRASRPVLPSPERLAARPGVAASSPPIERVPPSPQRAATPRSPEVPGRSTRVSWNLLLFVAILAAVALAGYAIYLVSFT
jgi:hypothetical protein